ncbi:DNA gyrase inhibitor YacG [Sphingomonas kyeonggiensis]|uniref:DNA gyrase inhibitor YacG n=1 Tax=Sphingomonas kyeonggiensis TaxID=1268553 RepID=A0A7W6NZC2_9SPHN|nr:DNA gyrase inhibitor YacG [Sphingomonas kyeonggiensis]MBB4100671.1 hypothetical protein [Sphingomonas kyeonggiensis]
MTKKNGCPVCGQAADPAHKPFCSRGCKDRDLLQWLGEGYRIPGEAVDPNADSGVDSPDSRY